MEKSTTQSSQFKKLLSNKLQAKMFCKIGMYNNFKPLSRQSSINASKASSFCTEEGSHIYGKQVPQLTNSSLINPSHYDAIPIQNHNLFYLDKQLQLEMNPKMKPFQEQAQVQRKFLQSQKQLSPFRNQIRIMESTPSSPCGKAEYININEYYSKKNKSFSSQNDQNKLYFLSKGLQEKSLLMNKSSTLSKGFQIINEQKIQNLSQDTVLEPQQIINQSQSKMHTKNKELMNHNILLATKGNLSDQCKRLDSFNINSKSKKISFAKQGKSATSSFHIQNLKLTEQTTILSENTISDTQFQQIQYLSRTKDKQFKDLNKEGNKEKSENLNHLTMPSCSEHLNFLDRQNSFKNLLKEFVHKSGEKNHHQNQQELTIQNQKDIQSYEIQHKRFHPELIQRLQSANTLKKLRNKVIYFPQKQLKLDKHYFSQQQSIDQNNQKKRSSNHQKHSQQAEMVDQVLFETYLDTLKHNYSVKMSPQNSNKPISIDIYTNKKQDHIIEEDYIAGNQSINNEDSVKPNQEKNQNTNNFQNYQIKATLNKYQNQKKRNTLSHFFNPNAYSQEVFLSSAQKQNVLFRSTKQKDSQNNSHNDEDSFGIRQDKIQQQIESSIFNVVSSEKQNNNTEDIRILQCKKPLKQELILKRKSIDEQQMTLEMAYHSQNQILESRKNIIEKQDKLQKIEMLISSLNESLQELKQIFNFNASLFHTIQKLPGYNSLIKQMIIKDSAEDEAIESHELKLPLHVENAKEVILQYFSNLSSKISPLQRNSPSSSFLPASLPQFSNTNFNQISSPSLVDEGGVNSFKITQNFGDLQLSSLHEIFKIINKFCQSVNSLLFQKRQDHINVQGDEIKTEIKQISSINKKQINELEQKSFLQPSSVNEIKKCKENLQYIFERNNYIKRKTFIEKFEEKETTHGKFQNVNERSRVESKCLNGLDDIFRDFNKYS